MQISLVYALAFLICSRIFLQRTSEHSNGLQRTTFSFGYHADAQESTSIPSHNQITKAKRFVSQTSEKDLYPCRRSCRYKMLVNLHICSMLFSHKTFSETNLIKEVLSIYFVNLPFLKCNI